MENLNGDKNYPKEIGEQKLYSFEPEKEFNMARRYVTQAEKQVYRKLAILGITTGIILVVLFFWGLPILARLAGVLTFLPGGDSSKNTGDVIPPFPPRLEGIPVATNSAQIKLTGFSEPESNVEIFLNGALAKKLSVDASGRFEIENFSLTYGTNKLQLKALDKAQNTSPQAVVEILFDNTSPSLEISEPATGTVFFGQSNLVKIAGKTDPETTVLVGGFWAIVDAEGNFSLSYPAASGENKLEVVAQDTAGNQTKKNLVIYFSL